MKNTSEHPRCESRAPWVPWVLLGVLVPATVVAGPAPARVDADLTWGTAGSPYELEDDLVIAAGARLTIEAGVEVVLAAGRSMVVQGALVARGTAAEPILFHGQEQDGVEVRWGSVLFQDSAMDALFEDVDRYTGGSILEGCELRGAARALRITASSPYVHECTFTHNESPPSMLPPGGGAILVEQGAAPRIRSCTFTENVAQIAAFGGAIYVDAADPILQDNVFIGNEAVYGGALATDHMASPIVGNRFEGNDAWESEGGAASLISTVSAFLDNVVTGNHASKDGGGVHVCVDCDPHAVPFLLDNTITGNETDNEDPTEGAAGVGAAFLRVFQSNNVHGNTRDGEPSDFGWFHAAETVGGEWPDWVRDVAVAGNWWGTVDPEEIEATIFDGADAAGYGRARWEPALEGPLDGPLPRLTLATEELSYPDPDDPMPVHLTLYNPGPLRELEVLILLEYTEGMRVPYQGGIGLPAERTAGGAYLVTLPEGAVHFATLVAPARPVETGTDHGEWHASLFDAATGERIGPVISSRWDFPEGSEP